MKTATEIVWSKEKRQLENQKKEYNALMGELNISQLGRIR